MKEISPETSCFICKNRHEDVRQLALQASKYPDVNMAEAVVQIADGRLLKRRFLYGRRPKGYVIRSICLWNNVHRKLLHDIRLH